MRPAGLILPLILACVALCSGADAASPKAPRIPPPIVDKAADASGIGLRGAATPTTPTTRLTASSALAASKRPPLRPIAALPVLGPPRSLLGDAPLGDNDKGQCRMACAHAYYLCSSGGDASDCPGNWSACLADCSPVARPLPSRIE